MAKCKVIRKMVADEFNLTTVELLNLQTDRRVAARGIAYNLCREFTDVSLSRLGLLFNKDRVSVYHSINVVFNDIQADPFLRHKYNKLHRRAKQYLK